MKSLLPMSSRVGAFGDTEPRILGRLQDSSRRGAEAAATTAKGECCYKVAENQNAPASGKI